MCAFSSIIPTTSVQQAYSFPLPRKHDALRRNSPLGISRWIDFHFAFAPSETPTSLELGVSRDGESKAHIDL